MAIKTYIDGAEGTTGLQLKQRLLSHPEIQIISADVNKRKDLNYKLDQFSNSDLIFLCLPDNEASLITDKINENFGNEKVIIDASSAHRVSDGWVYGFPELNSSQRQFLKNSNRITNPGCYPTGALSIIRPLVENNFIDNTSKLIINAVSGYTGGGKKLIDFFSNNKKDKFFHYSTFLNHKHTKEIKHYGLLEHSPIFCPSVAAFPQGMAVSIPLHQDWLNDNLDGKKIYKIFKEYYNLDPLITIYPLNSSDTLSDEGFFSPEVLVGSNRISISIFSNEKLGQIWLIACLDNLGKGASGAAVQNLNVRFGFKEDIAVNL